FINEHFLRYIGKRFPVDYDTVPLGLFLGLHLLWIFPWCFFLPLVFRQFPRRLRALSRSESAFLLYGIWIVLIILFFSFSTRQEYYTMPVYPAFLLLIGAAVDSAETDDKKSPAIAQSALLVMGCIIFIAAITVYWMTRNIALTGDISTAL